MLFNSHSATDSILKLEAVFEKLPPQFTDEDLKKLPTKQILNELHNMVLQAGALARYFWPVRKEHKQRGELLCKYFDMSEESPLFSRVLRNAIEHFDERLDKYFEQENIVGYFFQNMWVKSLLIWRCQLTSFALTLSIQPCRVGS